MKNVFRFSVSVIVSVVFIVSSYNCSDDSHEKLVAKNIREGLLLSQTYCKTCHLLPDPVLLNKATWANYVLPKMGELVGFRYLGLNHYVENGKQEIMKLVEWNKIVQYYTTQSPGEPVAAEEKTIKMGLKQFKVQVPSFSVKQPSTTMVNAAASSKGFFFGDGLTQEVYFIAGNSTAVDSFPVRKGISNLRVTDTVLVALTMGVLKPSDSKVGSLDAISITKKNTVVVLDSLQRPVHVTYADLTGDNLEDIIVCEFGNNTGRLSWYENNGGNKYTAHILRSLPGAIKTAVYDFNKDGLPDIIAMMAQGDEGMFIYYNQGNNTFKEQRILQLPPTHGSNYFELADFNKDGFPDIIATNGDNGDYPPVLKAYHGIRIYLNDGNNNFKEKIFLHVNGIGKAVARDFDGDGDIDIASIAFFPDYKKKPEEGFCYWENKGGLSFEPSSFKEVSTGRWLTMDAGDIDGDGDIDIVLGNADFFMGGMPDMERRKMDRSNSVLLLKNILH